MAIPFPERLHSRAGPQPVDRARAGIIPWTIYAVTFAATAIVCGLIWDISWHRSIGRDKFLNPAHITEYIAAVVTGISCGYLAFKTTWWGTTDERAVSVQFWGFRAPLGAWVCTWGALSMLVSAPFDNWWHAAYGLDIEILTPPHTLLLLGMTTIVIGAMMMVLAAQNRASDESSGDFSTLYAYAGGCLLLMVATALLSQTALPNGWRSVDFYKVSAMAYPVVLVMMARTGKTKWPATQAGAFMMLLSWGMSFILQFAPATPRLGPVYNPITHFVAAPFPLLMVVSGFALDLLVKRFGTTRGWRFSLAAAVVFMVSWIAAHWTASAFLLSSAAENPVFFGPSQFDYNVRLGPFVHQFWNQPRDATGNLVFSAYAAGLGIATLYAFISARFGLWFGNWMVKVRR